MRSNSIPFLLFFLVAAAFGAGCYRTAILPPRPMLVCVEPVVPCLPGRFDRTRIDTSETDAAGWHLAIDQVEGLSQDADEFGIAFVEGRRGTPLATNHREGSDAIHPVRLRAATIADVEGPLSAEGLGGSIGGPAGVRDSLLFAGRLPGSVSGDYDIFAAARRGAVLEDPERAALSRTIHWDAQPALSADGTILYFVSSRPGGFGGTDIWLSRRVGNGWSEPENPGPGINTPCDELSPFASVDGRWLYFSSSGHATVGGYDLFRAPIAQAQYGSAENLGLPLNTPADELFPSVPPDAAADTLFYFSSNQSGSRGFDDWVLHRARRRSGSVVPPRKPDRVTVTGTVRDPKGTPVDSAIVTVEQRDPPGPPDSTITDPRGRYEITVDEGKKYQVTAGSGTTLYSSEELYVPPSNRQPTIERDIVLPDTVTFRINFPFNNATDPYEFTLDDHGLPTSQTWTEVIERAAKSLRLLADEGGARRVEVVGHTDPIGSDPFNMDLGRRRAEFVRRELVKRGVPAALLTIRSEGETRPLAMRPDEPDERYRARLRRVELILR